MKKLGLSILFGTLFSGVAAGGNMGGVGMARSSIAEGNLASARLLEISALVNEGRLVPPANFEAIVAAEEVPVTELSPADLRRLRTELKSRLFAPLPNDSNSRATSIGDTVYSQDLDMVVREIRGYDE